MRASYAHGVADKPLIGLTIGDLLDQMAAEHAGHEALVSVFENQRFTYKEFLDEVNRLARALMAIGVQKNDRVGIWSTNCVAWVMTQFATAKIGAVMVSVNPSYRLYELEFALKQCECQYLLHGTGFRDADYGQMLRELIGVTPFGEGLPTSPSERPTGLQSGSGGRPAVGGSAGSGDPRTTAGGGGSPFGEGLPTSPSERPTGLQSGSGGRPAVGGSAWSGDPRTTAGGGGSPFGEGLPTSPSERPTGLQSGSGARPAVGGSAGSGDPRTTAGGGGSPFGEGLPTSPSERPTGLQSGSGGRPAVGGSAGSGDLRTTTGGGAINPGRFPHLRRIIALSDWKALLAEADRVTTAQLAERQASLEFDEVINIQYTSGTTGFPKGAMLTHHNVLNDGFWVGERMRFTHRDRVCIPVPFYHCFGMTMGNLGCVTHGATMVLPAPHFSPLATLQAVAQERCTALYGVPTMFIGQLNHPRFREFDLTSLRTGCMAGAPCPIEIMQRVISEMHCPEITIACGQTETSPVCNMTEVDDPLELRVSSVGKVMPHQEQKIIDPATGHILPRGEPGELCYRGYQVMRGYYNNPEGTRQMIDAAHWLHSGDIAVMNEQGYVKITGRLKDMICRGGEKIFPREVEEFFFTHPKIAEASVIGVPDDYYGEAVMAWIKLKPGQSMTTEELHAFCKGRVMDYKIPKHIKFVTEFPTTVTGKIQKFRMREMSIEELGLKKA